LKLKDKYRLALQALEDVDSFYKGESYRNPRMIIKSALQKLKKPKTTIIKKVTGLVWKTTSNLNWKK
jgi:hypothetical protein|tara:strand:+ start:309 stop:509 length:201 start_codon:yes stop_codon:yes gene_type:complete